MSKASTIAAYVGTFEIRGQSAGIEIIRFDASTGGIERGETVPVGNPSHLAIAGGRGLLFAAAHSAMFEGEPGGAVVAFRIDPANGALDRVNHQIMPFPHPNYIIVDRDEQLVLVTAGIGGGVSAFPIQKGALAAASANLLAAGRPLLELGETLGEMSGEEFLARRATSTSPHAVMLDPSNRFAAVMDAGTDRLLLYSVDCAHGTLNLHQTLATKQAGAAPRHAAFHPNGETLYVVNEGSSNVTVYAFDSHDGQLAELATFPAVPAGRERGNAMGDIKVDRQGRYLYCSNRGDESIAVFAILEQGRALERIETTPCRGEHPRGLCLSPDGRFLLVANQGPTWRIDRDADSNSSDAGVVVFAVDPDSGGLMYTGHSVQIDSATCIAFRS
jgi:6-phosphogluconolactonase